MNIKVLVPIFFSILIGFLFGQIIFKQYNSFSISTFEEEGEVLYFVELDTFNTLKETEKNYNSNEFLIILEENLYKVYGGITKNEKTAEKIKDFYNNSTNNIYVRTKVINNDTFVNLLTEYDKVALITTKNEDIIELQKIIMSNYKEIVLNNEFEN